MAVFELRLAARSGPPGSMYAYDYAAVARAQLQFLYSKNSAQHSLPLEPWPWLWPSMVVAANPLPRATAGPMATPLSGSGTISGGGSCAVAVAVLAPHSWQSSRPGPRCSKWQLGAEAALQLS